jgi:hypothetical protein
VTRGGNCPTCSFLSCAPFADLFGAGRDADWRNRLIWGDKKYVLPALLDELAGKVDLIYVDEVVP